MKTKTFDCVNMKRRGARRVREEIGCLTREKELEYWSKHSEELRKQQDSLRKNRSRTSE